MERHFSWLSNWIQGENPGETEGILFEDVDVIV